MTLKQTTLTEKIYFSGKGLFTAEDCRATIHPSLPDTGIVFIKDGCYIPATSDYLVSEDVHTTSLSWNGIAIRSVEHLLSALFGSKVDNAFIEIEGPEVPFFSADLFTDLTTKIANITADIPGNYVRPLHFSKVITYASKHSYAKYLPASCSNLKVKVFISYPQPIGKDTYFFAHDSSKSYCNEIAGARSFLRKGIECEYSDGKNHWQHAANQCKLLPLNPFASPVLCHKYGQWVVSPVDSTEPVRHKVLDLIGDLALIGTRLYGELHVMYPGHRFNQSFAAFMRSKSTSFEY